MFLASFPAGPWQTNCYVVATGPREECLVIDPGYEAGPAVADVVREHGLKPVAVLLTHGHLDHMVSVTPVCADYAAQCWVHGSDRELLSDPWRAMGPGSQLTVERLTGGAATFVEPDDVRELVDGATLELAGITLDVLHAPGHTPGSVLYRSPALPSHHPSVQSSAHPVVFSGDVLFAGSIGRTDLLGGSPEAMLESLRTKVLPLPDEAVVLPGHGPQTTIARERAHNPYLQF